MSVRDIPGAFDAVMRPAAASPLSVGPAVAAVAPPSDPVDYVAEFVDVCDAAIDIAFDEPPTPDLLPGLAVEQPLAMLKAYLLYLAATAPHDQKPGRLEDWFEHVDVATWRKLGFERRPARLHVELAFALAREREHQAPELRGLIALVELLSGAALLRGVRA